MTDLVGKTIGPYQVIQRVRVTPTDVVYKAFHSGLGRKVAIQVIQAGNCDPEKLFDRLSEQARALAQVSHAHIGSILDCQVYGGQIVLAYDFAPLRALRRRFQKPLLWEAACRLLQPVAQALADAHRQEVIHGRLRPASILITEDGAPVVFDFGIEQIVLEESLGCLPGGWLGSEVSSFLAPEVVLGQPADHRADQYSFGMILFDLVMGRRAYAGETPVEEVLQQYTQPLPEPRTWVRRLPQGELPPEGVTILKRSLQPDPNRRFAHMQHLASLLGKIVLRQPILPGMLRSPDWRPRRPVQGWVWLAAVLVGLGSLLVGGYCALARYPQTARDLGLAWILPEPAPTRAPPTADPAVTPEATSTATGEPEGTLSAEAALDPTSTPFPATPTRLPGPVSGLEKPRSGLLVLSGSPLPEVEGAIDTYNADRLEEIARLGIGRLNDLAWSEAGQLALATSSGVYLLDAGGDHRLLAYLESLSPVICVAFSPNGDSLAFGDRDGLVHVYSLGSAEGSLAQEIAQLPGHSGPVNGLGFSADGKWLASASEDKTIHLWDRGDLSLAPRVLGTHASPVNALAFAPDSRGLVSVSSQGNARAWSIPGGEMAWTASVSGALLDVDYSVDGQKVFAASSLAGIVAWDAAAGGPGIPLEPKLPVKKLAVAPDGSQVAGIGIYIEGAWSWPAGGGRVELAMEDNKADLLVFSPDARLLASADENNFIRFYDMAQGAEAQALRIDRFGDFAVDLEVSPDGRYLAAEVQDQWIKIWDLATTNYLFPVKGSLHSRNGRVFSYQSDRLAAVDGNDAVVYRLSDGVELFRFSGHDRLAGVAFSADGNLLAAGRNNDLHLWSLTSGQEIDTISNPSITGCTVTSDEIFETRIAFSNVVDYIDFMNSDNTELCAYNHKGGSVKWAFQKKNGTPLVANGAPNLIQVWLASDHESTVNWLDGTGLLDVDVDALIISPSGSLVAAGISDHSIQVWRVNTKTRIQALYGHQEPITALAISPDDRYIISASEDGTMRVWGVPAKGAGE